MNPQIEIIMIAVVVAVMCVLPGTFLVLRKMSMATDAITHSILLGIVLAFFVVQDLSSPFLIVGATIVGVVTMWLSGLLQQTKLVSEDASIGLVFPLLFSIAIILISRYAGSVHLDTDSVLLGELAFAPFKRMIVFGVDIGPKALYMSMVLLLINVVVITLFFKELKLATFDPILAAVLGFSPTLIYYGLITLVSLTTVGAFQTAGSVVVVAFMIGPPAAMYLWTDNLKTMLLGSAVLGAVDAVIGVLFAYAIDVSIAGSIAVIIGISFLLSFVFSKRYGMIHMVRLRAWQKQEFKKLSLMFHLYQHSDEENEAVEAGTNTLYQHLYWSKEETDKIVNELMKEGLVVINHDVVQLTSQGMHSIQEKTEEFI